MIAAELADLIACHSGDKSVVLVKRGNSWNGRCPFHYDTGRPNFYVFRGRDGQGRYACRSCGEKGGDFLWRRYLGEEVVYTPDPRYLAEERAAKKRRLAESQWWNTHLHQLPEELILTDLESV